MPKKSFVLDTNVLIHDPDSFEKLEDNDVYIPISVIEELDVLKKKENSTAHFAREACRKIAKYADNGLVPGKLKNGVYLPGGGVLRIIIDEPVEQWFRRDSPDNRIISAARALCDSGDEVAKPVVLISKDANVRIKAQSIGLCSQDYRHDKTSVYKQYGHIFTPDLTGVKVDNIASVRYLKENDKLYRLWGARGNRAEVPPGVKVYGISPRNDQQRCLIDALLNPFISLVCVVGRAGTGKTLLAIASGLHLLEKKGKTGEPLFEQVKIARPVVPMGNDIGFLPGDMREKMSPWMQPIRDNLEVLMSDASVPDPFEKPQKKKNNSVYKAADYLIESGMIDIEPLTYIRGRSLSRRFFIVDEAQNLTPRECKTIITRAGEGTKIVFTGDLEQIDSHYLDAESSGLSHVISRMINEEYFCYIRLDRPCRSVLAERAAELL